MSASKLWQLDLGARPQNGGARFRVWAPFAKSVGVHVVDQGTRIEPLTPQTFGYFEGTIPNVQVGSRYRYVLDDKEAWPDPASRFQPDGVHGPSAVIDPEAFHWTDGGWRGLPLSDLIVYELHTGTFSREGTFEGVIPYLDYLKQDVGITAVELLPVAQFPGRRNWGYDGTYLYAPQSSYGGPDGLKRLVDACHRKGLAVIMDVVYNHIGPEGNYLGKYGPYFTERYRTPWGSAVNYDDRHSDEVRHYVISNALYWVTEYHIDGLRLDAIHGIFDFSASHVLKDLATAVHREAKKLGRRILVIAESDLNDVRVIAPVSQGGYGLDAQWNDDFHHALRVVLTSERLGYYQDFSGLRDVASAIERGFVYDGRHSAYRGRVHGNSSVGRPANQFVVFAQNHDQIGNRAFGDRLTTQLPFEALKATAAVVVLSPNIPLLYMGEEYAETAPFQYFIEHGDPELIEAVRQGRRREFAHFGWQVDIPDPQDPATFERCRLALDKRNDQQQAMLRWTKRLIELRKTLPAFRAGDRADPEHQVWCWDEERVLVLKRGHRSDPAALVILGFNPNPVTVDLSEPVGTWQLLLDSSSGDFGGKDRPNMPSRITIGRTAMTLHCPPFGTAVYISG